VANIFSAQDGTEAQQQKNDVFTWFCGFILLFGWWKSGKCGPTHFSNEDESLSENFSRDALFWPCWAKL